MGIRILGGLLKGLSLFVANEQKTRPTSVLLKRRLFDYRQNWEGIHFCDLCAGTGSIGFESWSRGAAELLLIEKDYKNLDSLKKNIEIIKNKFPEEMAERKIEVKGQEVSFFMSKLADFSKQKCSSGENWCLFFDPPYEVHKLYHELRLNLEKETVFSEVWIESDNLKGLPKETWPSSLGHYNLGRSFEHGDHYIIQYVRN